MGQIPLADYDESIYAEVAHQAYDSGKQLEFRWLGNAGLGRTELWFEKPPLMIWLIELAYSMFGVNEFAARFWVVIFALGSIFLSYLFASKIANSKTAGIFAAVAYLLSTQYISNSSILQFDIPVGFFILLALYSFWQSRQNDKYHFLFWIAVGGVFSQRALLA